MRHILIAAAGLIACGMLASTAAQAQTFQSNGAVFEPGGPARIGNMCKVTTDDQGNDAFGYYAPCAVQAQASAPAAPAPRHVAQRHRY
ncbi:MAG TPA: hypothetical protein VFT69_19530 [Pseudolabrys sp.]|jgi:hypothetical protein|nr:hypothetical protein [Pseudolabrys sp.]